MTRDFVTLQAFSIRLRYLPGYQRVSKGRYFPDDRGRQRKADRQRYSSNSCAHSPLPAGIAGRTVRHAPAAGSRLCQKLPCALPIVIRRSIFMRLIAGAPAFISFAIVPSSCQRCRLVAGRERCHRPAVSIPACFLHGFATREFPPRLSIRMYTLMRKTQHGNTTMPQPMK